MKTERLVFPDSGRCEVEEVELNQPAAGEVLLKTRVSLISAGTELSMFMRTHAGIDVPTNKWAKYPFKPGYLAISEVVAGDKLPAGTRVFTMGYHATYSIEKVENAIVLPAGLKDEHAAFYGLLRIAMTAPRLAPVRLGGNVVVIGMGIVGNLCAQAYRLAGGVVAGADLSEARLERARSCGLTRLFCTAKKPLADYVTEFGPRGAEWIIEAVGNSNAISDALKCVAKRGTVVLLGSPRKKMEIDPYFDIHCKGISIIGAHGFYYGAAQQTEDQPLMLEWLTSGKICVEPLITQRMNFRQAQTAYEGLRDKTDQFMGVMLTY